VGRWKVVVTTQDFVVLRLLHDELYSYTDMGDLFRSFSVTWDLGAFGKKVVKLTNQGDTFDDYEWRGSAVTSWYRISLMVWGRVLDYVPIREVTSVLPKAVDGLIRVNLYVK
jgi:hypothetical protein